MKPKSTSLEFGQVTPGWHQFEIEDRIAWIKYADQDQPTKRLEIYARVIGDGDEDAGRSVRMTYSMDKVGGRMFFSRLLYVTKMAPKIEKEFNISADLDETAWGNQCLDPDAQGTDKILNTIFTKFPGHSFNGLVAHRSYKDRDNNDAVAADMKDLDFFGPIKEGQSMTGSDKPAAAAGEGF